MRARRAVDRLVRSIAAAALLGWAGATLAAEPTVVLLSLDGVRHDDLGRGDFPALDRMARDGARADGLVPPFPSNTFPAHVTLATGTHPDRHGILGNRFVDPERGLFDYSGEADWIEAEPLWVAAERQGIRAGVIFWVGSVSDWRGVGASLRVAPFDSGISEREKTDRILQWLDLPAAERPRLVLSWWHGVDSVAHRRGPAEPAVADQLASQDAELERLLAGIDARGLWKDLTLIAVSDHGMARAGRGVNAERVLRDAGIAGRAVPGGGMAHVYLEKPEQAAAAVKALDTMPGIAAYTRDTLPGRLRARHRRTGDVVAIAKPPLAFPGGRGLLANVAAWFGGPPGVHGYDPELPEMHGIFLALGRGVPVGGRLGTVQAVDVAPTVADLLGMAPPADSEGLPRLGKNAP